MMAISFNRSRQRISVPSLRGWRVASLPSLALAKSVGCRVFPIKSWFALCRAKIEKLPDVATLEFVPIVLVTSVLGQL